jgi:PKD repeat protein
MPEDGTIQNVTMYHEGGSGGLILGVYDGATLPANRLGVTPATSISSSAGWQTIDLTTPAFVAGGTTVWLAWVYENIPGVRYETGTPGRAQSTDLWAGGMPDPFGTSTQADFLYSIYASYIPSGGQPPTADFSASATTITEGDSVTFTDLSTQNPDAWDWTFEGGTPGTSTTQNPTVTYYTAGTYTVTLTASNAFGSDTETKVNYITVEPPGQPPVADFTASATTITEGDSINFTDLSTNNPDTWDWTFAGGTPSSSTLQNPTVTYYTQGTYTVTLTATNAFGSDTETKVDYITVEPAGTCIGEITNPGFETGTTTGWTEIGSVSITSDAHAGSYAVSVDAAGSSVEQVVVDLCGSTTYTVSCWGKAKSPAGLYLGVKSYGGTEQTVQFTDHKTFVQKSITFTTGATNTSVTIFVSKSGSKFDGVADDFTIVKN